MSDEDLKISEELLDGRVYAGLSPRTGKPMHLTSAHLRGDDVKIAFGLTEPEAQESMKNLAPHGCDRTVLSRHTAETAVRVVVALVPVAEALDGCILWHCQRI